jgi:hypothetical protein
MMHRMSYSLDLFATYVQETYFTHFLIYTARYKLGLIDIVAIKHMRKYFVMVDGDIVYR